MSWVAIAIRTLKSLWVAKLSCPPFCIKFKKSFLGMEADIVQLTNSIRIMVCFETKVPFFM
jgi:hypothetical protein